MGRTHSSTPTERAQWVSHLIDHAGEYGVVTELSRRIRVSRQTLYTWCEVGRRALEQAFAPVSETRVVTRSLERDILTLLVEGHASERGIQACLYRLRREIVSLGTISAVIQEAQRRARQWFATHAPPTPRAIALDEMYGSDRQHACLSMVDVHSWAVWATDGPFEVDGETWILLGWIAQDAGLCWNNLVSDAERAILDAMGVLAPAIRPQRDIWHVEHRCSRAQKHLASQLTRLQQQAERGVRYAERVAAGERRLGPKPTYDIPTQAQRVQAAERVVKALRCLGDELHRLLAPVVVDRRGILDSAARQVELEVWLTLLAELRDTAPTEMQAELEGLHTHVRLALPGLLAFALALDSVQAAAASELGPSPVALIGWAWLRRHILAPTTEALLAGLPEAWHSAARQVIAAWETAVRASSAVENWHSLIRPPMAVHRQLSSGMLALLGVWHNHRVFTRGAHKGQSPLHLSGLTEAPTDWLVALGYPPDDAADRSRANYLPDSCLALAA